MPAAHIAFHEIGGEQAAGRLSELRGDVATGLPAASIRRQVPHQLPHVGKRLERHDIGDDERSR